MLMFIAGQGHGIILLYLNIHVLEIVLFFDLVGRTRTYGWHYSEFPLIDTVRCSGAKFDTLSMAMKKRSHGEG